MNNLTYIQHLELIDLAANENRLYHHNGGQAYIRISMDSSALMVIDHTLVSNPLVIPAERDLRLDLFRGIALWLIFLDHNPSNIVSWITIRNYGFSDATEIFIFIAVIYFIICFGGSCLVRRLQDRYNTGRN